MATRVRSRRALRDQHDEAESREADDVEQDESDESSEAKPAKKPRAKKAAKPKDPAKPRAPRKKAVKVPPRMFAHWAVCDGGLKRVAVFDYKDRAAAEAKLVSISEQKKGPFCLLLVKDAYEPPPSEEPAVAV
jgi:hypothetical protein